MYRDIEKHSNKNRFTRFMHHFFFLPANPTKRPKPARLQHRRYEGETIRNIFVVTFDPFGYSVNDTAGKPLNVVYETGNALHVRSQQITIRNILLIREHDAYDSVMVKESERLVRGQFFVSNVLFYAAPVRNSADSIDLYVRVLDK